MLFASYQRHRIQPHVKIAAPVATPAQGLAVCRPVPVCARYAFGALHQCRGGRETGGSVMECHDVSCFVMGPASAPVVCAGPAVARKASNPPCRFMVPDAPLPEARPPPAHDARVSRRCACARAREAAAEVGFGHRCLLRGQGRDGRSLFRAYRAPVRARAGGRIAAARFARVIARVRAGRAEGAPLPPAYAGGFAAPSHALCRKAERQPRKPPFSHAYSTPFL